MCRAVKCPKCGKADWAGCGAHVEQVLGHVPPAERCGCRRENAERASAPISSGLASFWRRFTGGNG